MLTPVVVVTLISKVISDSDSCINAPVSVQPVLVSGIHKRLNGGLWKADSFNQEFADHQGDLLNCKDQVVSNSGIKEFWDGFEDITSEFSSSWFHCLMSASQSFYILYSL